MVSGRVRWSEDEEFAGDDVDRVQWRKGWRRRGAVREDQLARYLALLERRVEYRSGLAPCQLRRVDAMRRGQKVNRRAVYDRDGGICQICLQPVAYEDLAIDHILPIARGGTHCPDNVQASHRLCNSWKGSRVGYVFLST